MLHRLLFVFELAAVALLVLLTRCANYRDIFVAGEIHFVDADCYARMTRARMCLQHPGTIVWHHEFENYPGGTSPHTTAVLDYCIAALAATLSFATPRALDWAGALISPLFGIALGIFLCWWTRKVGLQFRWASLLLYASSPILAHGFALGRPDHQSLMLALVAVALCAEWILVIEDSLAWSIASGATWALALWLSLYEPLVLLILLSLIRNGKLLSPKRRIGWMVFGAIIAAAFLIERRFPAGFDPMMAGRIKTWSHGVGELQQVSINSPLWFEWCGWLLILAPLLCFRRARESEWLFLLFLAGFAFTVWQVRWAYFFTLLFVLLLPVILRRLGNPAIAWSFLAIGLFPIAQAWDNTLEESNSVERLETRLELAELHNVARRIDGPFMAPWWFSPALAYWSGQPGIAGSSHESISGIVDSANFFAATDFAQAREICRRRRARWIVSYDAERVAQNTATILNSPLSPRSLAYVLDRTAGAAPPFLFLQAQTGRFKLFLVREL